MKGLVTVLTHWKGLIRFARSMVCFTPFIRKCVDCMARLLSALSPWNIKKMMACWHDWSRSDHHLMEY